MSFESSYLNVLSCAISEGVTSVITCPPVWVIHQIEEKESLAFQLVREDIEINYVCDKSIATPGSKPFGILGDYNFLRNHGSSKAAPFYDRLYPREDPIRAAATRQDHY